ncbi:hypothetical protein LPJ61_005079 [Coemansia biformis]|uniref:Uncharacterized protein n=1 Tax=Coemansia biformis TaxID=1286918 RepID=A0A9W7Y7F0_9FUNG|nr:hypothetical protein LPJ61_005079 [Coemansia biformis]
MPDVIAGDAEGHVTLYTLGRRFSRNTLPAPVSALAAVSNPNAPSRYLVGDMGGRVASCHAQETIWKVHIDAMAAPNSLRPAVAAAATPDVMVNAVCEVWMPDRHGLLTNYMAVASGHGDIQLFALSMLKHTIPLACPCTCVCPGIFTGGGRDREDKRLGSGAMQAVLGDEAGRLFVLDNFEVEPYAQLDYPITRVFAVPLQSLGDRGTGGTDIVVCQTRSDTVFVLHNRRVVATYTSDFWPAVVGVTAEFGGIGPAIAVVDSGKPGVGGDGGSSSQASIHIVPLCPLLEGVGL